MCGLEGAGNSVRRVGAHVGRIVGWPVGCVNSIACTPAIRCSRQAHREMLHARMCLRQSCPTSSTSPVRRGQPCTRGEPLPRFAEHSPPRSSPMRIRDRSACFAHAFRDSTLLGPGRASSCQELLRWRGFTRSETDGGLRTRIAWCRVRSFSLWRHASLTTRQSSVRSQEARVAGCQIACSPREDQQLASHCGKACRSRRCR